MISVVATISIHALRGEGDAYNWDTDFAIIISIHALRGEGDKAIADATAAITGFQSTPSVGRATPCTTRPRSLDFWISIHALRGEGDFFYCPHCGAKMEFQSTPSVGRATSGRSLCF